jgi:hypothetical protein
MHNMLIEAAFHQKLNSCHAYKGSSTIHHSATMNAGSQLDQARCTKFIRRRESYSKQEMMMMMLMENMEKYCMAHTNEHSI